MSLPFLSQDYPLGGRETLHRDLDKSEGSHQLHEISKEQVLASAPGLGNFVYRLGCEGLESSPMKGTWVLVKDKLNLSQECALAARKAVCTLRCGTGCPGHWAWPGAEAQGELGQYSQKHGLNFGFSSVEPGVGLNCPCDDPSNFGYSVSIKRGKQEWTGHPHPQRTFPASQINGNKIPFYGPVCSDICPQAHLKLF